MLPAIAEDSLKIWSYWIGAVLTLGIYTVLYRENRVYRLLEHFYIGLAVGFGLVQTVTKVLDPVWFKAMVTEKPAVIADFDKDPKREGFELNKIEKKEGDSSWRWQTGQAPKLSLTDIPTDWGAPNYLKLWLHLDQPVPDGKITLSLNIIDPDTKKPATMSMDIATDFSGWREMLLDLRNFSVRGQPYRTFEKVGKYRVLGDVMAVEFIANDALRKANATIHLDELRYCIGHRWWWAFAAVIGLMFYTVLSPRFAWMSRTALSVLMGLGAGYTFKGFVLDVGPQIYKSFKPILPKPITNVSGTEAISNIIFIVILLCVMVYFFFSIEHRHPVIREPARLGRWLLMLTFGIVFGNTVMGRFSLFIGRLDFLILENPVKVATWEKAFIVTGLAFLIFLLAYLSVWWEKRYQREST